MNVFEFLYECMHHDLNMNGMYTQIYFASWILQKVISYQDFVFWCDNEFNGMKKYCQKYDDNALLYFINGLGRKEYVVNKIQNDYKEIILKLGKSFEFDFFKVFMNIDITYIDNNIKSVSLVDHGYKHIKYTWNEISREIAFGNILDTKIAR